MAAHGSGPLFASLFFDQINSPSDQEGFLLGKIIDHVQDKISDSQISNYKVETQVCIYSYLPWPRVQKLYNNAGLFSIDLLKQFLAGNEKDVIGWYKFRRDSTLRPSLRETTLHRNLVCALCLDHDQPEHFGFFLCSTFTSQNAATHSYDHCFLKYHHGKFHRIPVQIVNLGDTTHTAYRQQQNHGINPQSGTLHSVLHRFRDDFVTSDGKIAQVQRIRSMSRSVNEKLQSIAATVLQSEIKLGSLEEEVVRLSKKLADKVEELRPAKPLPPTSPPPPYMDIFAQSPTPNKVKIHTLKTDTKFRRSIGDSDGIRQVRQISVDEDDNYNPQPDSYSLGESSLVNVKEYDIIEGPENICQGLQHTSIADQSKSYPSDAVPIATTSAMKDGETASGMSTRRRTAATKTESVKSDTVEPGSSVTADHFSFVNNVLEKEKQATKPADTMAVPIGDKVKLPPGSIRTSEKSRTVKSSGKHKLHTQTYMGEMESGPEYDVKDAASVSKAKSPSRDVERSKTEMSANTRVRTRQGHGQRETRQGQGHRGMRHGHGQYDTNVGQGLLEAKQDYGHKETPQGHGHIEMNQGQGQYDTGQGQGRHERLRPRENFNGECVIENASVHERCQPARSCSPRNRQNLASKPNTDALVQQEYSNEGAQQDHLDVSSSPVY